jgi:hypothetical protein
MSTVNHVVQRVRNCRISLQRAAFLLSRSLRDLLIVDPFFGTVRVTAERPASRKRRRPVQKI